MIKERKEKSSGNLRNLLIIIFFLLLIILGGYLAYTFYFKDLWKIDFSFNQKERPPVIKDLGLEELAREELYDLKVYDNYSDWQYAQQVSAAPLNEGQPREPQNVVIKDMQKGGEVAIFWQAQEGVSQGKVNIYRSEKEGELGKRVASGLPLTGNYEDQGIKNNKSYYYVLKTEIKTEGEEIESTNAKATVGIATDLTPPQGPTNLNIESSGASGVLNLSWENPLEKDFDHINIYRSQAEGILGQLIKQTKENNYQDNKLVDYKQYFYTLTAVDASGNESSVSLITKAAGNNNPFKENEFNQ